MKKFSDFGIKIQDSNMFDVPIVSITDILNCEIEILDFQKNVTTSQGTDRYVVKVKHDESECKFFTNSKRIKQTLDQVPKDGFPFSTTIKQKRLSAGDGRIYDFI